jgi:4-hydroxybenzoate polyprenyltransferase
MQKLKAILTLIRFPNLVFIFLTQIIAYYFIICPAVAKSSALPTLNFQSSTLLFISTVLIAAAGYIINDYFDMGIDMVNKPHKMTIEKYFSRRRIIIWHILLNILGLLIAGYIAFHFAKLRYLSVQIICILLLLVYSTTFKRKLFSGNLMIAILTSLTLYTTALYEPKFHLYDLKNTDSVSLWIYLLFSFCITLMREIIKDIEDIKGDLVQNCKTIPLVFGINRAKKIIYLIAFILTSIIILSSIYLLHTNIILIISLLIGIVFPLLITLFLLWKANTSKQFHQISTYIKIITFIGILSMTLI